MLLLVLIAVVAPRTSATAARSSQGKASAVEVEIHGELSQAMVHAVRRGIEQARSIGASAIVYDIDSPGGLVDLMAQIAKEMDAAAPMRSIALVTGSASSAAAYLAIGCDELYMMPGTNIGSAKPIHMSPLPIPLDLPTIGDPTIEEKFLSEFRARFRGRAERVGRNQWLAEGMVDQSVELVFVQIEGERRVMRAREFEEELKRLGPARVMKLKEVSDATHLVNLTADEALEYRFIDGIVARTQDLIEKLGVEPASFRTVRPNALENFAAFVAEHSWLFVIAAVVFMFIELKIPGFGISGILSITCFALVLFANYLSGLAEMQEILLVIVGFALIAVELFVFPGTLIAGVLGALAVLVGVFLSLQDFLIPSTALEQEVLQNHLLRFALSLVGSIATIVALTRFLPRTPILRRLVLASPMGAVALRGSAAAVDDIERSTQVLIGSEGAADCDLRPAGKIVLGERVLDAVAEGAFVERGARVRVVKVEGNRIVVRPIARG
ncbi:MAG: NfeD family protein [Planctomycetota bacterium]